MECKEIITDKFKLTDHLNIIRMMKSDVYLDDKINMMDNTGYGVKTFSSSYHKIKLIRKLETSYSIGRMIRISFTQEQICCTRTNI